MRKSRKDEERERKTGEDTLAEQKALMTGFLDNMGVPYAQKFEIGSGDKISTRPVFKEVLSEIELGKYDAIAVKEISRLGRGSYTDMGQIYDLITTRRIYIVTPYKIYDPKNESDLRQIRFEMFLSREEFESIKTRLIGAKYTYAMQGKYMGGKTSYGYVLDEQKMVLVPHEEESKIVKLIYELYLRGVNGEKTKGINAIANYLTSLGVESPSGNKIWGGAIIKYILSNPVYKGDIHYRTTERINGKKQSRPDEEHIVVKDAHMAIVSEEDWNETQSLREKRNRKLSMNEAHMINELTGVCRCGSCGYKMTTNIYTRKWTNKDGSVSTKLQERIKCAKKLADGCGSLEYREVEDALLTAMENYSKIDEDLYAKEGKFLFENSGQATPSNESSDIINVNIEKQLKNIKNRLEFVYEKYESGVYNDEEFLERKQKIELEKDKLEKMVSTAKSETNIEAGINYDKFTHALKETHKEYKRLKELGKINQCNTILRNLFASVNIIITQQGNRSSEAEYKVQIVYNPLYFKEY